MKRVIVCAMAILPILAFSCMQKQPDGTYQADPAAVDATKKVKEDAVKSGQEIKKTADEIGKSDAAQKIKNGSVELGRGVKEGLGVVAQKAGAELQKAGKTAEDDVKKADKDKKASH